MVEVSSERFEADPDAAIKTAAGDLVFVIEGGAATHVLMTVERYRLLGGLVPDLRLRAPKAEEDAG